MKDDFIGIASHKRRTPLTGIQGYAEPLIDGLEPNSPRRQWAERVNDEAQRLSKLVSDLLDASRLDSGSAAFRHERVILPDWLMQTLQQLQAGLEGCEVRIQGVAPREVETDPAKLRQVLTNLLDNAVKYSDTGQPIDLLYSERSTGFRLQITDHGQGIAEDQLEPIFERFHRLEAASPEIRGTGLGLYITRQLVELMGGELTVQSKVGVGGTFRVDLPSRLSFDQDTAA